ncbi:uncharacterized protein LOC126984114 [Eriocheir sinensis]|uniref:uncharacterized protein LOC126984114 n=1 Tax=Eriocheir sinensis TaxID=95602 RepID=UPI0021C8735A|nr:uncharacterized protein LOC126984114 [Eriocheir sinensis]
MLVQPLAWARSASHRTLRHHKSRLLQGQQARRSPHAPSTTSRTSSLAPGLYVSPSPAATAAAVAPLACTGAPQRRGPRTLRTRLPLVGPPPPDKKPSKPIITTIFTAGITSPSSTINRRTQDATWAVSEATSKCVPAPPLANPYTPSPTPAPLYSAHYTTGTAHGRGALTPLTTPAPPRPREVWTAPRPPGAPEGVCSSCPGHAHRPTKDPPEIKTEALARS